LLNPQDKAEILGRLRQIQPSSGRRWGKMTAPQMICHLADAFEARSGERGGTRADNLFTRTLLKWIALYAPAPWPHGFKTMPQFDQQMGGTPPSDFERDLLRLESLMERFAQMGSAPGDAPHPIFGRMTDVEWQRWGYLHCDHHLRQFGA
jgi:hypothetical protein